MARPLKYNLDKLTLSVGYWTDKVVSAMISRYGCQGEVIFLRLLAGIARNGYYLEWTDDVKNNIALSVANVSLSLVEDVVQFLLNSGYFHAGMFSEHGILTSRSIQLQYSKSVRRRKDHPMIYDLLKTGDDQPKVKKTEAEKCITVSSDTNDTARYTPIQQAASQTPPLIAGSEQNESCRAQFFSPQNKGSIEILLMNLGLRSSDLTELKSITEEILNEWNITHTVHRDYADWSRHLIAVIRIKLKEKKRKTIIKPVSPATAPSATSYAFTGGFDSKDI